MKRFFVYVSCAVLFSVGVGAVVEGVGARFKSDAKALEIIAKARQAIGGDTALAGVNSIVIKGQTTHTINIDGQQRSEQGQTEIVMQMPNHFSKMVKIGNGGEGSAAIDHDVIIMRKHNGETLPETGGEFTTEDGKKFTIKLDGPASGDNVREIETGDGKKMVIVRKIEGGEAGAWTDKSGEKIDLDGKTVHFKRMAGDAVHHGGMKQNEMLRMTLSLLITAPEGIDVSYAYVGEGLADGVLVNTVDASFAGSVYRLHFDKASGRPVAMSYTGHEMPIIVRKTDDGSGEEKAAVTIVNKLDGPKADVETFVRFGDYRSVNGVQLPYRWTTSVGGQVRDVFEVTSYEVNPADIAERIAAPKVFKRTAKPADQ